MSTCRVLITELTIPPCTLQVDWQVAMAAATAADKSAMAAAGGAAAQLAARYYVFEGTTPQPHLPLQQLPHPVAQPSQSGCKPGNKPRNRVLQVRALSRQVARQVKPTALRTFSDAAFESALQPATARAEAPASKRPPPPPPPSCYHPHPAAADMALQPAPALQLSRATQQPLRITAQDQVPPPVTVSLPVAAQDQVAPPVTISLQVTSQDQVLPPVTASAADGTPVPGQGSTGAACKTVSFGDIPLPLSPPTQQPPVMLQQRLQLLLDQAVQQVVPLLLR